MDFRKATNHELVETAIACLEELERRGNGKYIDKVLEQLRSLRDYILYDRFSVYDQFINFEGD